MGVRKLLDSEGTPTLARVVMDPEQEALRLKEKRRRHYLNRVPLARCFGFFLQWVAVALHWMLVPGSITLRLVLLHGLACLAYCLGTWGLSLAWERRRGSITLARAWFLADPWMWNLSILVTGGAQSWMFMGLFLGLGSMVALGTRPVATLGVSCMAGYLAVLAVQWFGLAHPFPLGQEVLKVLLLGLGVAFLYQVAKIVVALRAENQAFLELSRTLNRDLQARAEELSRAKDLAEAQSQAKSRFLAGMSHELRTPLNTILLYGELIEGEAATGADPALAEDAHRLQGAGRHLLQLVNDLLDLSKIEAGRMDLNLEPLDLPVLLDEVDLQARPLAQARGNRFEVENAVPPDGLPMQADPLRLRQILLNLLGNAAKFTEQGEIRLRVQRGPLGLLFEVSDTGIGMDQEQLGRLFQDFVQADPHIANKYGGSGLGLALSMRLAERMGGRIEAESRPGRGSTFSVHLPLQL